MKKQFLTLSLALGITVNVNSTNALASGEFTDVTPTFWAYEEIQNLKDKGIAEAKIGNYYKPADNIKRSKAARMLVKAKGLENSNYFDVNYPDVSKDNEDYKYIAIATQEGIFRGKNDGTFGPDEELTRGQMAKVIVETFDLKGKYPKEFKDVPISNWAHDYISELAAAEVTTGYSDGTFRSGLKTTRAQMAAFIYRAIEGSRFEDPNLSSYASTGYFEVNNGLVYFKENNDLFLLDENLNPYINVQVHRLASVLLDKESYLYLAYNKGFKEYGIQSKAVIKYASNSQSAQYGIPYFSFNLYDQTPFNVKSDWQNNQFSNHAEISLLISDRSLTVNQTQKLYDCLEVLFPEDAKGIHSLIFHHSGEQVSKNLSKVKVDLISDEGKVYVYFTRR